MTVIMLVPPSDDERREYYYNKFVEIGFNKEGMIHISKLAKERVEKVTDVVNVGDKIMVRVIEIDDKGRINLSRKAMLPKEEKEEKNGKSHYIF